MEYLVHKGAALKRCQLHVTGIVQGVGFRPFVYRYALEFQLTGTVLNNAKGVTIELQGTDENLTQFITTLNTTPPPLARIDNITKTPLPILLSETTFEIIKSDSHEDDDPSSPMGAQVAVSADKSTCQDCLNDMHNPDDRHFGYAFTNCTNCGPRYTIINALPYDRHNTAMADFDMCPECAKAYQNPLDRRYHAQPVSCPVCGPRLSLKTPQGECILPNASNVSAPELGTDLAVLQAAADRLRQGQILAIKGLGGFHLICDARSDNAVNALRLRKQRQAKPLAVMMADITMAQHYVTGTDAEWRVLSSQERPIVLMSSRSDHDLSLAVAPNLNKLGVFLPYTPLHHLLLGLFKGPLVATSANLSGEPIITDCDELIHHLSHVVDAIVDHNRPIINGCDDSVVQVIQPNVDSPAEVQALRLARGYAPLSFPLEIPLTQSILAVGAQQKNAIALGFGNNVFLSPHIGDLFSVSAEQYFERTLATFARLYHFTPNLIIRDKHPDYAPSRWAEMHSHSSVKLSDISQSQCLTVQHHHAHVLSVMAVNQYRDPVLGFSFDGTGLGDDGSLWGGEVLLTTLDKAKRLAHFEPIALLGGEQAIKQPVRLLLALLFEQMSLDAVLALNLPIICSMSSNTLTNLYKIWQNGSALKSSSVGRLFDALACALGLIETTLFEGQAGMAIEAAANRADALALEAMSLNLPINIDQWRSSEIFKQIVELMTEKPLKDNRRDAIARAFLHTLGDAICDYSAQYKHLPTVLCGGVFQNKYLLEYCLSKLSAQGNQVLSSKQIPINDGGIALGQLWYGIHQNH
ncbi:carbamoyltransferase HypF [Shewanella hafniensis]|uniref:carbamoyltransferase HypF n=1 Tax=Shewanella hafniensis TaxID=365590 RepID=UPI001BBA22D0|nr:carbamoyltransferase HypF [Shewanella hafniensis]MCL1133256.1 carbamoyltransferase HypF [Shewanella hafniensis]GIU23115.1 carbamoyltransferase HypF [Shewanella hafniensis]